ncbi:uncharacterized protein K02A2.6-like [Aedes albopictus]|uniref:RNA-directed DNA polymerase n=1 Tax=Aedes albopictus TaxID=7160 RepID=A0ABM1ZH68_AEDAL
MWEEWNRYIENFEMAATLSNANDPVRRSQLLFLSMGTELQGIVRAAKLRPSLTDANCYQKFVANIGNYFQSMTDASAEHEAFSNMKQLKTENAVAFHARLMAKVRLCGYSPTDHDRFVRSQLLKGLRNKDLVRAARTYGHDTNYIVQAATRDEAYEAETTTPDNKEPLAVNRVHRTTSVQDSIKKRSRADNGGPQPKRSRTNQYAERRSTQDRGRRSRCRRCNGRTHSNLPCPALSRNCNFCGEQGHYAITCRRAHVRQVQVKSSASPTREDDDQMDQTQYVNALSLADVLVECCIGSSSPIQMLIDSGADVNVIGGKDWLRLEQEYKAGLANLKFVEQSNPKDLRAYGTHSPMKVECIFQAQIVAVERKAPAIQAIFYVVRNGTRSLLGRSTASDMGILHVNATVNHLDKLNDLTVFPKVPGVKVKFSVDETVPPVRNAYYNVPAAFREAAKNRLAEMESQGIIEKVTSASNWISGMSAVAKGKDDFRLVVNMRGPNRAINREYFRLPLLEEMKVQLHGSKFFAKLDLKNAFYHLELHPESRDLTTFLTENGMYRFTRLMFGVNCAPEIFQREMTRILKDVKNKIVYIDDVLMFASSLEDLRKTVCDVLERLRSNNLTLNAAKCEFDKTRLKFLGYELDEHGFHVDDAKIKSIQQFREPSTISELRSFLGLASFISPHVKHFADITSPLWEIIASKSWTWGAKQSAAFNTVKEQIIKCCVTLGFFSEDDKTILYTDASPVALGAVLVQEDLQGKSRIISFASKSLTITERKYAQNQREALGAVWAVEHFSFFLLGRHFTLRTDAQGVSFILNRSREDSKRALTRADGWALRLSPYNYTVEYVRGADNIADPSSRLYSGEDKPFDEENSPWEIASLEANTIEFVTENEIKAATSEDKTLQEVMDALKSGHWPRHLRRYQLFENDLDTRNGMLVKTGCVIIPETLRKRTLEVSHQGHPSAAKHKSILRQRVWWPGMNQDAQKWVDACATCAVNGRPEKPTPMQRIFAPKAVWETIALDFNGSYARFGGISILVVVDYKSRYLIARPVKSTSFEQVKKVLEDVFEREGTPKFIKSDNGPPFNGQDYKTYCESRDITTIFSTPLFPQQNGLVESYMKLINKAMASATLNGTSYVEELSMAIQAHNAACHSVTQYPPEEIMTGRKIKRCLPLVTFEKTSVNEELFSKRDREAKEAGKKREDQRRGARPCRINPGDTVIVERHTHSKGESRFLPRRYTVVEVKNGNLTLNDEDGNVLKRHVSQTKKVSQWRIEETPSDPNSRDSPENSLQLTSALGPRSIRERKAPSYLQEYVRLVDDDL